MQKIKGNYICKPVFEFELIYDIQIHPRLNSIYLENKAYPVQKKKKKKEIKTLQHFLEIS